MWGKRVGITAGRMLDLVLLRSRCHYWSADEYDEQEAYYVSYHGSIVSYQPKSWGNPRHGYPCVREP
ncbi:MAG: hypothetical protein WCD51_14435 [Anaerolineae bacterium]